MRIFLYYSGSGHLSIDEKHIKSELSIIRSHSKGKDHSGAALVSPNYRSGGSFKVAISSEKISALELAIQGCFNAFGTPNLMGLQGVSLGEISHLLNGIPGRYQLQKRWYCPLGSWKVVEASSPIAKS